MDSVATDPQDETRTPRFGAASVVAVVALVQAAVIAGSVVSPVAPVMAATLWMGAAVLATFFFAHVLPTTANTERRTRELATAHAGSAAKSRFLAAASHEFRTPLSGILGMTNLLRDTELTGDQKSYADAIHTSSSALMELVNDLLDYSKIEAGKLELAPQDVDVALLTRQLVELLAARAHAKNIELVCEIAPDLPKLIWIDGNRLRQVLVNLIGNAIKFTQTGGVTVRLSSTAGKPDHINLGFEIEDSGIGIEQSAHERVFGEFEQIDGSSTRQFGGTGLGLAISRRIIRKMGGDISIASRPGEGTTFSSSLSVAVTDPTPNRFITAQPAQRLLILSPHPRQTAVIAAELKHVESDCQAFAAVNPAVATFSAAAGGDRPYTLVLLDHACDPVGTMQAMRENVSANKPSPRFAVMLPPESRENLQQLAADGFDAYVIRPLRVETLHALLAGDLVELENMLPSIRSERTALPQIGSGRHVLVAEDNEINAILLNAFLTKIGYQVHIATDGVEAVKAYENSVRASSPAFDLVICDLRMPRLDGAGTVAAIRKIESQNGLPRMSVFALSADVATEVSEQALAAGFDGVFSKPLDPAAFTQMLSHRNARAA